MKIYDNSNLAESYSGATTPLTFSFARYVYQEVYKSFCQMMGVDKKTIEENSDMYPEMVISIAGHMYYDLTNWYKMISLLPGYSFNKGFLEEMLGVNKKMDIEAIPEKSFLQRWFYYFPKTLLQILKILISFIFMDFLVKRFNSNFDSVYYKYNNKDLSKENEESLKKIFNKLMDSLVVKWKIPIANDFAVMISTGIVHKLFNKWLPDEDVYTFLYVESASPLISLDPGLVIVDIVEEIKKNDEFLTLFTSGLTANAILIYLDEKYKNQTISLKIFDYIKKYGDRMPGELKLESKCLGEHPEIFIQIIINAIKQDKPFSHNKIKRAIVKNFNLNIFKKYTLLFFLRWARKSIQMREETRFKRTLIFGFARKIFLKLGQKYVEENIISNVDDIFYLTLEEIIKDSFVSKDQFKKIVKERNDKLVLMKSLELPRRIETDMTINDLEKFYLSGGNLVKKISTQMKGMVVSTGDLDKLLGESLVMKEFDSGALFNGKIVVTSHTDPGWSLIFPMIAGLIVERGGMLSHAAIVARELGIPCIVGVENATKIINTGEQVILDLESGSIVKK